MPSYRFYNLQSGVFLTRSLMCPASWVQRHTPEGFGAYRGQADPQTQRVDISAVRPDDADESWQPPLVPYKPPAPADTAEQTWAWSEEAGRWQSVPTLAGLKRQARQRMAAAWNEERQAGVLVGGKRAPTDPDSWTRYLAIKAMAGDGGWIDVPIPLSDGTFELLTQQKAAALWSALKSMEVALLGKLRSKVAEIEAATTAQEVAAVVW